jgi:S1-C subfamily serine protease
MVQVAEAEARGEHGVRAAVFVRALARQMATESSRSFRITVLALMVAILGSVGLVYREAARRTQEAAVRLETAERVLAEQIQSARAAQERSDAEIKSLRRELEQARRAAVSRLVLDSLERRLREAEARAARPQASGSAPALDLTRLAAENRRAVGLVLARFGADSTMGSGFAITRSGYFVTSRHVVRDPERADPQAIEVRMAETRTSLAADVVAVSSVESQDIAVLKIRNYRGDYVRSVDWDGVTVRQGAPAAIIGFPGGTQNALDPTGQVLTTMFSGIIAQVTTEWVKFGGTTFSGASGSPIFNADGAVVAVHYGGLREGPGLGFSVPIGRVRRWLPPAARSELGLP